MIDAVCGPQQHCRCTHSELLRQHGLNLAQLDAEAADLHLIVGAPQALHLAVGIDAGQVPRAIQTRFLGTFGPGVRQEFARRQVRATKVALRHARARDAQLTGLAGQQQLQGRRCAFGPGVLSDRLDHHQHVVGQRAADGHRLAGPQFGQTGRDGGLGRAVSVEHLAARARPAVYQGSRAHLAAQVDDAQPGHIVREQRQQRGHGMQHGDAVISQQPRQQVRVAGRFGRS